MERRSSSILRAALAVPAALALLGAACAHGDAAVTARQPAQGTARTAGAAPATLPTCGLPDFRAELLRRLNELRAKGASCGAEGRFGRAGALRWNDALAQAAAGHARDMAERNYLEHDTPEGVTPQARVDAQGYPWRTVGENIAAGQPTVEAVMASWLRSPGHCANMLRPALQEVGVACTRAAEGRYGTYWAMVLAAPMKK